MDLGKNGERPKNSFPTLKYDNYFKKFLKRPVNMD